MRGVTLDKLLFDLRVACRMSVNAALNTQHRDHQVQMLQRKQEFYWADFDWPHLRVDRFIDVQAGQRYYDMPADLDIDRITCIEFRLGGIWQPVRPGIDAAHYAAYDSDTGVRGWPVQRWQITEDEMLELWPVPEMNFDPATLDGRIKITGIRKLKPLVKESDRCDLDDQLLVKSVAADFLAAQGAKDAQLLLDQVNRYYAKLRGQLLPRKVFSIGVNTTRVPVRKIFVGIHNKTN